MSELFNFEFSLLNTSLFYTVFYAFCGRKGWRIVFAFEGDMNMLGISDIYPIFIDEFLPSLLDIPPDVDHRKAQAIS